jgi:hypothetical protein
VEAAQIAMVASVHRVRRIDDQDQDGFQLSLE